MKLTGRLAATPQLKQIAPGRDHFCLVEVQTRDCNLPVRFVGPQAEEISRWQKGCKVVLSGRVKRYEWVTAGRVTRERMVVICSRLELVQPPLPKTQVRDIP